MSEKQIMTLLGAQTSRGGAVGGRFALADIVSEGLRQSALQRVMVALELSDVEIAAVIGMSQKTISRLRKKTEARLGPVPSDRLYRLAALYSLAEDVFDDQQVAREWLKTPQPGLNNRIPLDLMNTEVGAREVENLLGRIEYGVLS